MFNRSWHPFEGSLYLRSALRTSFHSVLSLRDIPIAAEKLLETTTIDDGLHCSVRQHHTH